MKDLNQEGSPCTRARPFSKELDDIAPIAYEEGDRKELMALHVPHRTMALPFTPWTSRDFFMTMEWRARCQEC